jgi:type IV pilus assembly protein PilP
MAVIRIKSFPLVVIPVLLAIVLAGCGGSMDDLVVYIDTVKARPSGRIEPLPEIRPYETFAYTAGSLRSPFVTSSQLNRVQGPTGPTPIANRNREYLEQFPLDTLSMVGTLERGDVLYGLIQDQDGLVHRLLPGNYIGQNDGQVTAISTARIDVEELVPNGTGGFFSRDAAIGLN